MVRLGGLPGMPAEPDRISPRLPKNDQSAASTSCATSRRTVTPRRRRVRLFSTERRRGRLPNRRRLVGRVGGPERDSASQRTRAGSDGVTVIAALHDPVTVVFTDDLSDVMAPDHDSAHARAARIGPVMGPRPRQIIGRTGVAADLAAHIPAAPRARTSAGDVAARRILRRIAIGVVGMSVAVTMGVVRTPGCIMMSAVMDMRAVASVMIVMMIGSGLCARRRQHAKQGRCS